MGKRAIVAQFLPGMDGEELPRVCHHHHGAGGRVTEVVISPVVFSEAYFWKEPELRVLCNDCMAAIINFL